MGFIPVGTGRASCERDHWRTPSVYPRRYGASEVRAQAVEAIRGISPQVRGELFSEVRGRDGQGYTPAGTGGYLAYPVGFAHADVLPVYVMKGTTWMMVVSCFRSSGPGSGILANNANSKAPGVETSGAVSACRVQGQPVKAIR